MRLGKRLSLSPWRCCCFAAGYWWRRTARKLPLTLGGFNTQGSATVGYRFDDVKGYVPMFQELSDLEKGFRLMDFNMFGEAPKGPTPLPTATPFRSAGWEASLSKRGSFP